MKAQRSESLRRTQPCPIGPDEPASLRLNPARRDGRPQYDLEGQLLPGMTKIRGFSMEAIR